MSANLSAAILETVLGRLAILFLCGSGGDLAAARHAASEMLASYHPETTDEVRLAAEIISFSFHALEALSQAADPAVSFNQTLRLRGSAVSLSREAHKSQRKLDQLQTSRQAGHPTVSVEISTPELEPARPRIDKAMQLIEVTRETITDAAKHGGQSWSKAYQQRQTAKRITANLRKHQASATASPPLSTPA